MWSKIAHGKTIKLVDGQVVPQLCSCSNNVVTDVSYDAMYKPLRRRCTVDGDEQTV